MIYEKTPYKLKFVAVPIKTGEVSIHGRITMNRRKSEFATGIRCKPEDWDEMPGRFKAINEYNNYLNNQLSNIEGKMLDCYIRIRNSGDKVTAAHLKRVYCGKTTAGSPFLLSYLDQFIARISRMKEDYKPGTVGHYRTLKNHLTKFLLLRGETGIRLNELKRSHIIEFEDFFLTTDHPVLGKPVSRATTNKNLRKLKVVIGDAVRKEVLSSNPFAGFKMDREKNTKVFLNMDEIRLLSDHDLGGNESLDRVRKLFLFSVYTGLRFSDAISLRRSQVSKESDGMYWLDISQKKTFEPLYRPLLKPAADMFEYFVETYPDLETVLPRISNQKTNAYLKVIAELTGIQKKLSHHVARHTFATTILLEQGVDLKVASHFLGHTSVRSTEVYAKVTKKRAVDTVMALNCNL